MRTFVLLYHGYESPSPHREAAWQTWFERRAVSFTDVGTRFGPGRRVTNETTEEFSLASNPTSGYSIVVAEHIDAAEQLLEGCPIMDSVTVYEVLTPEQEHDMSTTIDEPRPTAGVPTDIERKMQ